MKNFDNPSKSLKIYIRGRKRKESYIMQQTGGKCEICKEQWPSDVLAFHHLDPSEKELDVGIHAWSHKKMERVLKEARKCAILCMNCHTLEHKALDRGETLINDPDAYLRYRNYRIKRDPDLFDRADMDDRNDGPGDEDEEEFPYAFV